MFLKRSNINHVLEHNDMKVSIAKYTHMSDEKLMHDIHNEANT